MISRVAAQDVADPKTGEVLLSAGKELTEEKFEQIQGRGVRKIHLLYIDGINVSAAMRNTT
jgi:DNA-directed RNA polymerase subunit beta